MLQPLIKRFDISSPAPHYNRCLRPRMRADDPNTAHLAACRLCAESCPHGAITLQNGITIDDTRCTSCDLCSAVCPTAAISTTRQNLDRLDAFSDVSVISAGCKLGSDDGATWSFPVEAVCGLSWQFVAAAAMRSGRELRLDCRHCAGCPNGPGVDRVEYIRKRARAYLRFVGVEREIVIVGVNTSDGGDGAVSRREFFRTFFGRAGATARYVADHYGLARRSAQTVRELLWNQAFSASNSADGTDSTYVGTNPVPWAQYRIKSGCTGCGVCATVCPNDAWRTSTEGDSRTLSHREKDCLDCGACIAACPENVIYRTESTPETMREEAIHRAVVQGAQCRRCGAYVPPSSDELCENCEKQKSLLLPEVS